MRWLVFLTTALVLTTSSAWAQYGNRGQYGRQQQQRQQGNMQAVEIQGTLQNVGRAGIVVLDANNLAWRVAAGTATRVHVGGEIATNHLRQGLVVEVVAAIDNRGAIQDKVDTLTVTSLGPNKQLGFYSPGDQGDLDGGMNNAQARGRAAGKVVPQAAGRYRIVGRLALMRNGMLAIQPGRGSLPFVLGDKATIKVDSGDITMASRGNSVTVRGYMVYGRPGMAQAAEINVKLPELAAKDEKDGKDAKDGKNKGDKEQPTDRSSRKQPARDS